MNKILIVLIICFSFLMKSNSLKAQQNAVRNKSDSIALYKGSVIVIGNKSITAYKDTIVVLPKNIQYEIKNDPSVETNLFYDSLKTKSARNPITKELYDLLITHDRKDTLFNKDKTSLSEDEYKPYNGRKIRNITIKRLEAFGTSVVDTSMQSESWLAKAANDIHIVTFEKVIKGNLLIKKGEKLNSYLLAENERILRNLPFIYEAKIFATKVKSDSVDLLIVTRDLFSIGIKPDLGSRAGSMELYDLNFIGFGNELNNKLFYDKDSSQHYGYKGEYKLNNIKQSFINSGVFYQSMYDTEKFGIYIERSFLTTKSKYAGGLSWSRNNEKVKIITSEQNLFNQALSFTKTDVWLGRSISLSKEGNKLNALRLIFSARYYRTHFIIRPEVGPGVNKIYHQSDLYLTKIALSKRNYYKGNLIYAFGITEDIPYGYLLEFTTGPENREFRNRFYYGWQFSTATIIDKFGYLYTQIGFGGYKNGLKLEQSVLRLSVNSFSNLYYHNKYKFRNFFNLNYVIGINRFDGEFISLDETERIMQSPLMIGTQKLSLKIETVAFTPINFYGFKVALYGFWDVGVLGLSQHFILNEKYFLGVGAGLRIRNDNLVFQTFQLNFAYYPMLPNGKSDFVFSISGQDILKLFDFISASPAEVAFK
ncbi:MAG: hypothetical protein WCO13_00950 [Bacteroidota bacterium]